MKVNRLDEIIKQRKKPCAVMDIGTNSTRMLIFREDDGELTRINKSVRYTRMGQGVNETKELHPDAQKRNTEALEEFLKIAADYEVEDFYIFGTSAMRDASNTAEYQKTVKERLGLDVVVIGGEEEAQLGFMGVSQCFEEKLLVFDIGGGSTEFILGEKNQISQMMSLNMGCVRGTESFLHDDPPTRAQMEALNAKISEELQNRVKDIVPTDTYKLVGIGGTATSLSTIHQRLDIYDSEKVHKSQITRLELETMISELSQKTIAERQKIAGLEAKRADIILAGAMILHNILKLTGKFSFTVCDYDNLEGAAFKHFIDKK
ncbi:Ppx/GppA phosphatase family protein [Eubacteriaceae bacterium ES3]|nr:Ppx/GppA phosphatase family protein [Eubacteriaceae bacterium ES3]